MKRIGVLTSGGDAPGMNMAIRSVIREASFNDMDVYAVYDGFKGLVEGNIMPISNKDIGGTLQYGGTILGTERYLNFKEPAYRRKAHQNLIDNNIEGLVVIGGNGSLTGAHKLFLDQKFPIIGVPGSIDNDIFGTDMAIGVDTALNTIVYSVDKLKDTASSHSRIFMVEVMGRHSGYLALLSAIGCGALAVLIPELQNEFDPDEFCNLIYKAFLRSKKHAIIIKAEGFTIKSDNQILDMLSYYMAERGIEKVDMRVTKLGHIQRGGSPSAFDRILGSKLGAHAVRKLIEGHKDVMVGLQSNDITVCPLEDVITKDKTSRIKSQYEEYMKQEILMTKKLTPSEPTLPFA